MGNGVFKLFFPVIAFFCVFNLLKNSDAGTYYVDAGAANDSGNGSAGSPKKYIGSGVALLAPGDTLIIRDGVYTGANNFIGDYASPQAWPPSGSAGAFTTIRAEHVGQAVMDGQYNNPPFYTGNHTTKLNYVHVDGIHFRRGNGGVFTIYGDHDWISHCGFEDGLNPADDSEVPIASMFGGSSYGLVEDCWVWGKGRYGFYTSSTDPNGNHTGTHHMIFRRVVVRIDDTPAGWMTAGLRFYGSDTNTMQNCIIVDGHWNPGSAEFHGMATGGGSSSSDSNDAFYGNIVLNNPLIDCYWSEKGTGTHTLDNNVCWGNNQGPTMCQDFEAPFTVTLSHTTTGQNTTIDMRQNYGFEVDLTHELYFTKSGASTFLNGSITAPEYVYLAGGASIGSGASGYTLFSNATQTTLNNAGLKYLPRLENGSTLANAGVGATILYQIGGIGTFYGDSGWNATSPNQLWPLADEQMWAAKMASYSASGPGGNRGFAALAGTSTTPLTDYIWGYLGNPKPAAIYATSNLPPAEPRGFRVK